MAINQLTINGVFEELKSVRDFVSQHTNKIFSQSEKDLIILAVDEVCANFIRHSKSTNVYPITLIISDNEYNRVTFIIKGVGSQFDYKEYKEPKISEVIEKKRKGGMGLILVRRIMDSVQFKTIDNTIECTLMKYSSLNEKDLS
ncbi:MAG: ATP-binding protein [Cyclobacteriaceae bacterium]